MHLLRKYFIDDKPFLNFGEEIFLQSTDYWQSYAYHGWLLVDWPVKEKKTSCSWLQVMCNLSQRPSMWSEWVSNVRWARSCYGILGCKPLPLVSDVDARLECAGWCSTDIAEYIYNSEQDARETEENPELDPLCSRSEDANYLYCFWKKVAIKVHVVSESFLLLLLLLQDLVGLFLVTAPSAENTVHY